MLLLIDNYDSFTYNLFHYLGQLGAEVVVKRNDELTRCRGARAEARGDRAVARPLHAERGGHLPGSDQTGRRALCRSWASAWAIRPSARSMAASIVRAPEPMHGKLSRIHHTGKSVFRGLNNDFLATRYHSLTIAPESMPASLEVTATSDDGVIQGVMHKTHPVHGVQFHPESIASRKRPRAAAEFPATRAGAPCPA